jgi:hypothetical protein
MPLIAWSALAYAAGLLAGFVLAERSAIAIVAVLAAAALAFMGTGYSRRGAVVAIAAGAALVAISEVRRERLCAATLASMHAWTLRVDAPARAGGLARGELSSAACHRRAAVVVEL